MVELMETWFLLLEEMRALNRNLVALGQAINADMIERRRFGKGYATYEAIEKAEKDAENLRKLDQAGVPPVTGLRRSNRPRKRNNA